MGFSRQEDWSALPFPTLGDLPDSRGTHISCISCFGRQILYHRAMLDTIYELKITSPGTLRGFMQGYYQLHLMTEETALEKFSASEWGRLRLQGWEMSGLSPERLGQAGAVQAEWDI